MTAVWIVLAGVFGSLFERAWRTRRDAAVIGAAALFGMVVLVRGWLPALTWLAAAAMFSAAVRRLQTRHAAARRERSS